MSGIGIQVRVQDQGVLSALSRLALEDADKAALFDEIGINIAENTRYRFGQQIAPDGTAWKPSHRAENQGGETLRDTGRLLASITHNVLPDGVEVGTNVAYAAPLHYGAEIHAKNGPYLKFHIPGGGWAQKKSVTLPARPFLGLDAEDNALVTDIISHFLQARF